jgi:hypothetical protein
MLGPTGIIDNVTHKRNALQSQHELFFNNRKHLNIDFNMPYKIGSPALEYGGLALLSLTRSVGFY